MPLREDERFAVRVHVFAADGSEATDSPESYIGTSVDLSENGMLLKARKTAPAGSVLGVRFALPGRTDELSLRGRVVRADDTTFAPQHALALAFENVTAADRAALREYLRVLIGGRPFRWRTEVEENGGAPSSSSTASCAPTRTSGRSPGSRATSGCGCASSAASAPTACKSGSTSCAR